MAPLAHPGLVRLFKGCKRVLLWAFCWASSTVNPELSLANPQCGHQDFLLELLRIENQFENLPQIGLKYRLQKSLGVTGGSAKVFLGKIPEDPGSAFSDCSFCQPNTPVAVKVPFASQTWRNMIHNEARIAPLIAANDPPNRFVRGTYDSKHHVWLTEYDPFSRTLGSLLDDPKVTFQPHQIEKISWQLDEALTVLRQAGVVHGDLKPGNILITSGLNIRIIDFGISAQVGSYPKLGGRYRMGTPGWSSPSQLRNQPAQFLDDVYTVQKVKESLRVAQEIR